MNRFCTQLQLAAGAAVLTAACSASAQLTSDQAPSQIDEVRFEQALDVQLDPTLKFRDSNGSHVTLGDYFNNDRPLLLLLVYYECPSMCSVALNGLLDGMKACTLEPGSEYDVLTISFDPKETHVLADKKRQRYLAALDRGPDVAPGWQFLVGEEAPIKALTEAVGFHYKWLPEQEEYAHRSGVIVLTPEGRTSRYFPGTMTPDMATTLRLGLVEASQGKIGNLADKLFLLCYHYDPALGKYSPIVTRIVNIACGLTVLIIGTVLGSFFAVERRKRRTVPAAA